VVKSQQAAFRFRTGSQLGLSGLPLQQPRPGLLRSVESRSQPRTSFQAWRDRRALQNSRSIQRSVGRSRGIRGAGGEGSRRPVAGAASLPVADHLREAENVIDHLKARPNDGRKRLSWSAAHLQPLSTAAALALLAISEAVLPVALLDRFSKLWPCH